MLKYSAYYSALISDNHFLFILPKNLYYDVSFSYSIISSPLLPSGNAFVGVTSLDVRGVYRWMNGQAATYLP